MATSQTTAAPATPTHRRAKIRLNPETIANMIDLPPGHQIVAVDAHNDPLGFDVIVTGPAMPEVQLDESAPYIQAMMVALPVDAARALRLKFDWPAAANFTTEWGDGIVFPFVEDENCNITGFGHQDKQAFADAINRYDEVATGEPIDGEELYEADQISHAWATIDADGERLHACDPDTPNAVPITTLWGAR